MSGFYHTEYTQTEIKKLLLVGSRKIAPQINSRRNDGAAATIQAAGEGGGSGDVASPIDEARNSLAENREKIYLFDGVSRDDIFRIVKNIRLAKFARKEIIFSRGDASKECYFILSGAADIFIEESGGKNIRIAQIPSGALFGEMSFILNAERSASCLAAEDLTALGFEIDETAVGKNSAMLFLRLYINISNSLSNKLKQSAAALNSAIIP